MNLAKCFVAGLCLTAMSASAAVLQSESFEYGYETTWLAPTPDYNTAVTNGTTGLTDANTPIVGTNDLKVLKLDTEGAVWTNTVNASFETTDLYADMLVKFVPSEDLPTMESGKFAMAIKPNAGGTNLLNLANNTGFSFDWNETAQEISTSLWYRVTVKLSADLDLAETSAQVYINGTAVGSPLLLDTDITLNSIGFQGTGYIDEVVVRDDNPFGGGALLTLQFATGIGSVYVGAVPKSSGQTVTSGQELIIAAANFYEIASVEGVSTSWSVGGVGQTGGVVTVTSDTNATVTITAQAWTSTNAIGGATSFAGQSMTNVATWAIANGVAELTNEMYNQYLLNIDDQATVPDLLIKSIAVTNSTVTVTVEAGTVDFTDINGTLKLTSYPTLGGTPTTHSITFSGTTTATISQDISTNKFVKAVVE